MSERPAMYLHLVPDVPELKNIKVDKKKRRGYKKLDERMNIMPCTFIYDHPARVLSKGEREWYEDKYLPRAPGAEDMPFRSTAIPPAEYKADNDSED